MPPARLAYCIAWHCRSVRGCGRMMAWLDGMSVTVLYNDFITPDSWMDWLGRHCTVPWLYHAVKTSRLSCTVRGSAYAGMEGNCCSSARGKRKRKEWRGSGGWGAGPMGRVDPIREPTGGSGGDIVSGEGVGGGGWGMRRGMRSTYEYVPLVPPRAYCSPAAFFHFALLQYSYCGSWPINVLGGSLCRSAGVAPSQS